MASRERATCAGCGLVCDDIVAVVEGGRVERLERTCPLGDAWFAAHVAPATPAATVEGRDAELEEALDAAAALLADARAPLVYGLGRATCEAQRAAVALAEALGATIDPAGPLLDGASGAAFPARGASTATLGEVRDRAEVVVIWRADPATTHPRLFERLRLPSHGRTLVVVDERRTATAEHADTLLERPASGDVEALWTLRALVREDAPDGADPALTDLARQLRGARNAAILHHVRGAVEALALHALVRDLNAVAHAVAVTLRHEPNAAGAEDVLAWQTGYPAAVSFAAGPPRAKPAEHGGRPGRHRRAAGADAGGGGRVTLRIAGGRVYDPTNGVDGEVRDVCLRDGKVVDALDEHATRIDARGMVVMPGGVDIHAHIAGPKVNAARRLAPEEHRSEPVDRTAILRSGTGGTVPSTFVTGYRYALLGYTTVVEAAAPPLAARHVIAELRDTPLIDAAFLLLMGNNLALFDLIKRDPARVREAVAWWLEATGGYGVKLVNPGGVERWKTGNGNVTSLDDEVLDVTPRQVIEAIAGAVHELGLPHPVHVHCNNLGVAGNWRTTLDTLGTLDGRRAHLAHLQFHAYGGRPGG